MKGGEFLFERVLPRYALLIALCLVLIVLAVIEPALFSFRHFRNVLVTAAPLMLLSLPFTLCVRSGFTDLSFSRNAALTGVIAASLSQTPEADRMFAALPFVPVLVLAMILGAGICAAGSLFSRRYRVSALFSGALTALFLQGLLKVYLSRPDEPDRVLRQFTQTFVRFGGASIGGDPVFSLPMALVWTIIIAVVLILFSPRLSAAKPLYLAMAVGAVYGIAGTMAAAQTIALDAHFFMGSGLTALAGMLAGGTTFFSSPEQRHTPRAIRLSLALSIFGTWLCTALIYGIDFIVGRSGLAACIQVVIIAGGCLLGKYLPAAFKEKTWL
ncbi:MAG: hypothetical protein LBS64_02480 [Spirochaetaceae bacterium]|jgi:ABC-type glucose/galactose transport system permease subunit|nr:hypothetical protein [Spirochaetaceae bacterium]